MQIGGVKINIDAFSEKHLQGYFICMHCVRAQMITARVDLK